MKEIIFRFLIGVTIFLIAYLLGAFYNVSFNLSIWSSDSRGFVAMMGATIFIAFIVVSYLDSDTKK